MRARPIHFGFNVEPLEQRRLLSAGPTISVSDLSIMEGNSGTRNATVTVSLSAASKKSVAVSFHTEDGTARAGSDYQTVAGKLTFAPGEKVKTIGVLISGDRAIELDESFAVRLSSPSNAQIAKGRGVVSIRDDEPRVIVSGSAINEGDVANFTVSLSFAYDAPITLSYGTSNGTATVADGDYVATSGTLTFAPGETTKTVAVQTLFDAAEEYDEFFSLVASQVGGDPQPVRFFWHSIIFGELGDPGWWDNRNDF